METEAAYYRRRAIEEAAFAASAAHPSAREAHLELARRYSGLIEAREPTASAK
jgi:hypothetical protein